MEHIKLLTLFLILIIGGILLHSCSNSNSRKSSEVVEYQPEILDSDRIIKCYHRGATAEDFVQDKCRAMPLGNILISQNGVIKALQIQYSDGKVIWHEIIHFSIDDSYQQYICEATGKVFNYCADITYKDLEAKSVGFEENNSTKIFWN